MAVPGPDPGDQTAVVIPTKGQAPVMTLKCVAMT